MKPEADKDAKVKAMVLRGMEQDRMKLLGRQPFVGAVLMHLELVPVTDAALCPTAMTDGRAVYMNCRFYAGLDLEERLFVLAHETWHCVLLHFVRLQSREPHFFNIATDLEIHFILSKEKMKEPFVLPHDPAWDGLSAEEIYEKLKKVTRKTLHASGRGSGGIPQNADGEGFDKHVYKRDRSDAADGDDADSATAEIDEETVEKLRRIVIQSAQIAERRQGHLPAHIAAVVEKLRKPELKWQALLKQFVTSCYGGSRRWLPPARRYVGMGLYLQSRRDEKLENVVVALDISGSMTWDIPLIFSELVSLLKTFGSYSIYVLQCDTEITCVRRFDESNPFVLDDFPVIRKTGGNCFRPVFDFIEKEKIRPALLIYLTDGYLCTDDVKPPPQCGPAYPVLWVLTKNGEAPVPWGRRIYLKQGAGDGD